MDSEITHGVIVGEHRDEEWIFDVSSSFIIHPPETDKTNPDSSNHFVIEDTSTVEHYHIADNDEEENQDGNDPDDLDTKDPFEIVTEKEITCEACKGKHRKHPYDVHCKLGPDPVHLKDDLADPFAPPIEYGTPQGVEAVEAGTTIPGWFSCPACRGRKRKHTRDHRCRLGARSANACKMQQLGRAMGNFK